MLSLCTNFKAANATTQFTNFNFNSMVNFNGETICAGDDGIFKMGGSNDNGTNISAYFEPVVNDLGMLCVKRVRFLYFGYKSSDYITVTVSFDDGSVYTVDIPSTSMKPSKQKFPIPRSIHGTYFKINIANKNGGDFSIDSVDAMTVFRNYGIS